MGVVLVLKNEASLLIKFNHILYMVKLTLKRVLLNCNQQIFFSKVLSDKKLLSSAKCNNRVI